MSAAFWLRVGAVSGAIAVAAGAFGAHGLRGRVESGSLSARDLEIFETGARYEMYHALALVAVGLLAVARPGAGVEVAGWAFAAGTLIFCGTLYGLGLGGPRWLGAITPIGGVGFIVGWIALAVAAGAVAKPGLVDVP